ncbi:hypothetical protein GALMADRAFT_136339 [Galerina marginata CBS 339.88]|uniref:Secreted protein n=1 Tax=Galerina marginata (strain CBS 339.88) TaxID=685588 RepID=A0A067TQT8_GALM3|nr:hypothetical protein GALMADRAFT_136339 [Galerina marginata CBS 339.88]
MKFYISALTAVLLAVFWASAPAMAQNQIQAFSGEFCDLDGMGSAMVPCNGPNGCEKLDNNHSVKILDGKAHCVVFYSDTDCQEDAIPALVTTCQTTNLKAADLQISAKSFKCYNDRLLCPL